MHSFLRFTLAPATLLALAGPLAADPGSDLVVGLAPPRPGIGAAAQGARFAERLGALGLVPRGTLADGLGLAGSAAITAAGERSNPFDLDPARVWRVGARDSLAALAAAATLAADPEVEWVEPDQARGIAALEPGFPNDPIYRDTRQWWLHNAGPGSAYNGTVGADVHALEAWSITTGSNDLRLAIADTGVDPNHPEFQCVMPDGSLRLERGLNATLDPSPSFADSFGHGVTVAGVFAARTNDGWHIADSLGVAGLCGGNGHENFGCHLIPIKITRGRSGDATSFDIARAMVYATSCGARAMNLSFAGGAPSRVERLGLYYAITRGCVVSTASGNNGYFYGTLPQYPAAYATEGLCIQSGATDFNDQRAIFSSYGPGLDLVAPGVLIWSTYLTYPHPVSGAPGKGYNRDSGTSYAAPMVTGAVGLLCAARPELKDTDFQHLLRESADDIGDPGVDAKTGWGRLNVGRALDAVRPGIGVWHDEVLGRVARSGRTDTLRLTESGPGTFDRYREWHDATELEVLATVAIPDSFIDSVRVWPRVGGTMTVRGNFRIPYFTPWAEVAARDARSFTLRGFIYRQSDATCFPCGDDAYLPLPPDQARFGFTVMGRVDRAPSVRVTAPRPDQGVAPGDTLAVAFEARDPDQVSVTEVWLDREGRAPVLLARGSGDQRSARVVIPCAGSAGARATLRVRALDEHGPRHDQGEASVPLAIAPGPCVESAAPSALLLRVAPNPAGARARIEAAAPGRIEIADVSGRRVRGATVEAAGSAFEWDGRDDRGRTLPAGLYFVRYQGAAGRALVKLVRLDDARFGR
ncbi:MAG TPA: S8 family serine peptidase [Candidatus Eisenbacteria bacterium]|jgi:hypothetical protein